MPSASGPPLNPAAPTISPVLFSTTQKPWLQGLVPPADVRSAASQRGDTSPET